MKRSASPLAAGSSLAGGAVVLVLKLLWAALVISTPLLGAWVSSSLAAYLNGPPALAAAGGLFLFPVLPLLWDAYSTHRRKRALRGVVKPRILTFWDRFILRTLAVNLLFLGVLLGTQPAKGFAAISTRGDWMLDGRRDATSESIRKGLFKVADRLEWLYLAVHENPYKDKNGGDGPTPDGSGTPLPGPTASAPVPAPSGDARADGPKPSPAPADGSGRDGQWPAATVLHPVVREMPASAEASIASVARHIADRESDPARRFKAIHDWVADRIAYDVPAYNAYKAHGARLPPQDAEIVFRERKGVCAGYAKLLEALGKAASVEVVYVVGDARTKGTGEQGEGHAWNAVKIGGRYHLVDSTWNAGSASGDEFKKAYVTDYLLAPPEVFGLDHFPEDPRWQLRDKPISRGEFFRQPMMSPRFYAEGWQMVSPDRSQVTVEGALDVEMKNTKGLFTLADFVAGSEARGEGTNCKVEGGPVTRVRCSFPAPGSYTVRLFSGGERYGKYRYIGQIEANSR